MRQQQLRSLRDRQFEGSQASLALERDGSLEHNSQRQPSHRVGRALDAPLDRRACANDAVRQAR
jgi:hypothetical protein